MITNGDRHEIRQELIRMRRSPDEFLITGETRCKFCGCGKKRAILLSHLLSVRAAAFCKVHGFLWFDSSLVRPLGEEHQPKKRRQAA